MREQPERSRVVCSAWVDDNRCKRVGDGRGRRSVHDERRSVVDRGRRRDVHLRTAAKSCRRAAPRHVFGPGVLTVEQVKNFSQNGPISIQ